MSELAAGLGSLSQREFRVGGALSRAIGVFARNGLSFSLIAIVAWLPVGLIVYSSLELPQQERDLSQGLANMFGGLLQLVAMAVIIHATFQDMRGRPVRLGESAGRGLKRFFPLIGGGILAGLGMLLGLVLLIVPGIMLLVRWYVFAPVCVVERKGPLGALERSAQLTEGNRWKLFAIFIILAFTGGAVTALVTVVLATALSPVLALSLTGIWHGVWSAFNNVLSVVIYHDLRVAKEGADIESIASVFD